MNKYKIKSIYIGYDLNDWCIGIQFINFDDGGKHLQFLCLFIEWVTT